MLLNLHSHLEGCVRPTTAAALATRLGVPEPDGGWEAAMTMSDPGDLTAFLRHVAAVYPLLGDRDALSRVAREAVEDASTDGQDYLELRFGPGTHTRPDLPVRDVVASVVEGVRDGAGGTGLPVRLILCMLRDQPLDLNEAVTTVACDLAGEVVAGLDLAGDELRFPELAAYASLYARARSAGLGLTAHAGEAAPGEAVREAVNLLGVTRVGHGSRAADSPYLLEWARDADICFEVCPSSNVLTGAADSVRSHPIARFIEARCRVALGDDDPITTGVRLSVEQKRLSEDLPFTASQHQDIISSSIDVAFCDESTRSTLRVGAVNAT